MIEVNNRRPKLFPPLALLWQGPGPQAAQPSGAAPAGHSSLSPQELRRIVADLIG
jgi:hypothetical protein